MRHRVHRRRVYCLWNEQLSSPHVRCYGDGGHTPTVISRIGANQGSVATLCIERYQPNCFKINNEDGIRPPFDTGLAGAGYTGGDSLWERKVVHRIEVGLKSSTGRIEDSFARRASDGARSYGIT